MNWKSHNIEKGKGEVQFDENPASSFFFPEVLLSKLNLTCADLFNICSTTIAKLT